MDFLLAKIQAHLEQHFSAKKDVSFRQEPREWTDVVACYYKHKPIGMIYAENNKLQFDVNCAVEQYSDQEILELKGVVHNIAFVAERVAKGQQNETAC